MSKADRGFASMTPEKAAAIRSKGGKAAHKKGVAHRWTTDTAREAGRKGGSVPRLRRLLAKALKSEKGK